jgi:ribose transport system ATP-binding protein
MNSEPVLEIENISKSFPGVQALKDVSININSGEILGLVGENGAGKTTLMNVIGGVIIQDNGNMILNGQSYIPHDPLHAQRMGISFIHQELAHFSTLSITDNIFAGVFPYKKSGFIDYKKSHLEASRVMNNLGVDIDCRRKMRTLSIGEIQLVEIAKAISSKSNIVIFDEPTTSLTENERKRLFEVINNLKKQGVAIIFISHLLDEVFEICDRVVVLRDGEKIGDKLKGETNKTEVVKMMVGRELRDFFPEVTDIKGKEVLEIKDLSTTEGISNINLTIKAGEIVGMWGLLGSGRSEVARAVFGMVSYTNGSVVINGKEYKEMSPEKAINAGIGFLTENRREEGIIGKLSVKANLALPSLTYITKSIFKLLDFVSERKIAESMVKKLSIKTPTLDQLTENLSGGNQQKVVVGKWLALKPNVYLLDEPTKGIDVGAKAEIHKLIVDLAKDGASILFISSDIEEVLRLSHRIVVMYKGSIASEVMQANANKERLMHFATGLEVN